MNEKEYVHSVGKYIADLRKRKNLNQSECSEVTSISRSTISDIEKGLRLPSSKDLLSFCRVFQVTPNDILSCGNPDFQFTESKSERDKLRDDLVILFRAYYSFINLSRQSKELVTDAMYRMASDEHGVSFIEGIKDAEGYADTFLDNEDMQEFAKEILISGYDGDFISNDHVLLFLTEFFMGPLFREKLKS